jgi:hypothetical protein
MSPAENYSFLIDKINTFIRKYYFNQLLRGIIFLGAGLFSAYVAIALTEYFGNFNTLFRSILFYEFIVLNIGLIAWLIVPPLSAWLKLGKTLTHNQAAEIIGKHFNDVNDKLLNTLQLKKLAEDDHIHRELIEASIDQKIIALKPIRFPSAINIKENAKYLKWIIIPVAIIFTIALAAPSVLTESTKRLIRHNEYFAPVAPFKFIVQNPRLSVVQGDDLRLDLKLEGNNLPVDVYVETANNTFKLDKDHITKFHYLFTNLQQSTPFRLTANGFTSAPFEIKVNLRASLLHFDVDLSYPAYLHKKNETLLNAGDLTIPAGTIIKWRLHTQNTTVLAFYMNNTVTKVNSSGIDLFEHMEKIYKNSIYKINPLNTWVKHSDPAQYHINVVADEAPTISVQEKPDSISLKALYFNGTIQDDHGFTALTFHYKIISAGNKGAEHVFVKPVRADLNQMQSDFFYYWNLKDIGIKPGDQVAYFFEVADNDNINGPKKTRSAERTLNVPDAKALNDQLNAGTTAVKQKMQSAIKMAGQVERDAEKLNQLLLNKNTVSFDEKKQIEDLLQKRKDLDDLVKQIQDDNKKNEYNRRESQQQDQELTEKQQQIEQLLNNILDPQTREMLQKLQSLIQQGQKNETRDELSKMQMDSKSLKKELDRMFELYKKLDFDQKLNQTISQLNQLAAKQQELAEKTVRQSSDQNSLKQEQQKLKQDFQDIKKLLDDLQKTNEQAEHKQSFDKSEKDEQNIDQSMDQSTDQLSKNNRSKAAQAQQQSTKQMNQLAGKMQKNEEDAEESETNVDIQQLRELLKNLLNSSFEQEKVMLTLKTTNPADPNYITLAQTQKNIKDNLKTAEDSLYSLSRRIPQIQSTVNVEIAGINDHIDKALENLGDRHTPDANRNQQYAMTSMNNLALMLSDALNQLQQSKSGRGSSKQPSVSQLRQMQEQLNQNMQKMRDRIQQGNKGQSQKENMSEELAKLARQQQLIRQSLEQTNRDEIKNGGAGLQNADKISKEMEQSESDLVNRRITDEVLKRQQQIQSRLLEAEKAQQERDLDKQRESNVGKDMPPGYIKALQDYRQVKEKQTEQIKTVPPELNLYYKQKIKVYFDQLNVK